MKLAEFTKPVAESPINGKKLVPVKSKKEIAAEKIKDLKAK